MADKPIIDLSNLPKIINEAYVPLFKWRKRYAILRGGSGSGKSWAIAQKLIVRMLTDDNLTILCSRKTAKTIHESQFALLKGTINAWGMANLFKINEGKGNEEIACKLNGNRIIFAGLDDPEKLKSIYNIGSVWVEEASEIEQADFLELDRRLRGYKGLNRDGSQKYMQIILSFNPISILHWIKDFFIDNPTPHRKSQTLSLLTTYEDNKYIEPEYKQQLEDLALNEETMYDYLVYAKGEWGITGGIYFNKTAVNKRILEIRDQKPIRGTFEYDYDGLHITNVRWVDDDNGYVEIYQPPEAGRPYVAGADTAGDGSDWNRAPMIDNITGEQVAMLSVNFDEDLFARQLYCLGMHYNQALLGPEVNFSTHPVKELERLNYPKLYIRQQSEDAFTYKLTDKFGFRTTSGNRMDILGKLRQIVREHPEYINHLGTLYEMTTFVKNERGRPEAQQGAHDDCVMALAITYAIREQQSGELPTEVFDLSHLPRDVQDDFYRATPEMQRHMLTKWGYIK